MGAVGGPCAGMIFLGALFPQANWIVSDMSKITTGTEHK